MKIQRLDHLALAVQDMQEAIDSWAETFALRAGEPEEPEGSEIELAILPVSDEKSGDPFLELVRPASQGHPIAGHLEERGEGMFAISIEVADLDGAVRELQAKGVPVAGPEDGVLPDSRVARIPAEAAHGVALQLIERN